MKAGTICCYCISMRKKALQNHGMPCIYRARLTAFEVGIISREISQLLKIRSHPLFEEPLKFITPGCILLIEYATPH